MDFDRFTEELKNRKSKVDQFMYDAVKIVEPEYFHSAIVHLFEGGKRMRPALTLFACGANGGKEDSCIPVASAIELLNNYTLIHDDIIDKDETRRNVPTVHAKFGVPTALLAGDTLHSIAILSMSSVKPMQAKLSTLLDIIRLLEVASVKICEGQFYDAALQSGQIGPSEANYIKMAEYKTAYLFQTAAEAGSLMGTNGEDVSAIFREYGRVLGIGFQIQDDILGIIADEKALGKPVGSDIREGKMSFPVIHFLNKAEPARRQEFLDIFGKNVSTNDIERVKELFAETGSLDHSKSQAKFYAALAVAQVAKLNLTSYYRDLLETLVAFGTGRHY